MQLHQIQARTHRKRHRQIGRGGKRGTTAGRGTKGQKARAGHRIRPEIRDVIKRIPKKRGYRFPSLATKPALVNLSDLENKFTAGTVVSPDVLLAAGLVRRRGGKMPIIKILATGDLTKKLTVTGCLMSVAAAAKITKAGGVLK